MVEFGISIGTKGGGCSLSIPDSRWLTGCSGAGDFLPIATLAMPLGTCICSCCRVLSLVDACDVFAYRC